jgi:type III restriction enzyme
LVEASVLKSQLQGLNDQIRTENPASKQIISDHEKFDAERTRVSGMREKIEGAIKSVDEAFSLAIDSIRGATPADPIVDGPEIKGLYEVARRIAGLQLPEEEGAPTVGSVEEIRQSANAAMNEQLQVFDAAAEAWSARLREHDEAYLAQSQALVGQEVRIKELERLSSKLSETTKSHDAAIEMVSGLRNAQFELAELRRKKMALQTKQQGLVAKQAAKIATVSSGLARGELALKPRLDLAKDALASILDVPHMREQRIETLLELIATDPNPHEAWRRLTDELLGLLIWKESSARPGVVRPDARMLHQALDSGFLEKLVAKLSQEDVFRAISCTLPPRVDVFQIRGRDEIAFKSASQGEQAATLLNIVMNQSEGPLIVDQPEEDLDNRIINEIIKTIRHTKLSRQIVLATHNANITVNGDAELVTELVGGKRAAVGAIDEPMVRLAITDTMEGGKDAFELRRKKYNY